MRRGASQRDVTGNAHLPLWGGRESWLWAVAGCCTWKTSEPAAMVSVAPAIVSRSLSRLLVTSSTILIGKRRRKKTLRSLSGFRFFPLPNRGARVRPRPRGPWGEPGGGPGEWAGRPVEWPTGSDRCAYYHGLSGLSDMTGQQPMTARQLSSGIGTDTPPCSTAELDLRVRSPGYRSTMI